MEIKKKSLWIGIALILIAAGVIFPIEKTGFLEDLMYTFSTLIIGLLVIIYAISGGNFFKVIGFLLGSILMSMLLWFLVERGKWGSSIAVVWGGIPSGLISGILFLISNHFLRLREKKQYKYIKQVLLYFLILLIVSVLFRYGGDWYFDAFES
ncbi:membrane-associated HD superfamily phosphohydrolase [Pedobacter sp. AK013]|uniref:hypothetical protein n=1 Tax=Pedobacter sp. AK013 TaxID=2723071 RepID=UPI0016194CD2|nr:hypothetical protein [Pedobacter sp. AK013]MBB6240494.1 membrane-associated HD superfamily phosphohydrolase [Pedobacter sp. AK013]